MSFWAIWLVHSYYTMTSYYADLPFMARSSCSYCMDLPFLVDSIDSSAVRGQLQFFRSMHLSSLNYLAVCCIWWVQIKKFVHTVAETVLKFLLHLSSFVYVFKLHWFSSYQLAHAEFQQGRQSRVGRSFAVELQDFMKANAWKACALLKI